MTLALALVLVVAEQLPLDVLPINQYATQALVRGEYARAEQLWRWHLRRLRLHVSGEVEIAEALNALAICQASLGRHQDAEANYLGAYKIWSKATHRDDFNLSLVNLNLAELYSFVGRYGDAERVLRDALLIRRATDLDDLVFRADILSRLSRIYLCAGRPADAAACVSLAIEVRETSDRRESLAQDYLTLSRLHASAGRHDKAAEAIQNAAAIPHWRSQVELERGRLQLARDEVEVARKTLAKLLENERKKRTPDTITCLHALELLAIAESRANDPKAAAARIEECLQEIDQNLNSHPHEKSRVLAIAARLIPATARERLAAIASADKLVGEFAPRGVDYVFGNALSQRQTLPTRHAGVFMGTKAKGLGPYSVRDAPK